VIYHIYSNLPSFKNLEFHSGLNVLLADREKTATDLQTRNRAGKSSVIHIIHFLMGATAYKDSIFRSDALKQWIFGIDFDLVDQRISVERSGLTQGRIITQKADTSNWPFQPTSRRGIMNSLSVEDWCSTLGYKFFALPPISASEKEKFSPTFRSLFSYFVRSESAGGFRRPEAQSSLQQVGDQQIAVAYLLGIDWRIAQAWEMVRQREKTLKELRKAAAEGALGDIISTSAQLRTELILAEQASQRLQDVFSRFEVLPEYRQLEQEASRITREISDLANQNTLDEQFIAEINLSLVSETPPEATSLSRLYQEAGMVLPEIVKRRFEDVKMFHDSVISNRKNYLETELKSASERLISRRTNMQQLDTRRSEIMRMLQSRGALDQFQSLQREASRQDAQTEAIRQRFHAAEQLEGTKTELDIERGRLVQRLRRDLDEQKNLVTEAITTFENTSHALYEEAGSLTLNPTENGLKAEVRIQGQLSRGIQNMQVFCFDMMLMKLCSNRNIGPGFLVHDSHIFDGVDERQVAHALKLGAETASKCGWQYIVTMNSDDVPHEFPSDFNIEPYILSIRLTDATETGGLFGFRF